jgi:hypothetical protein
MAIGRLLSPKKFFFAPQNFKISQKSPHLTDGSSQKANEQSGPEVT